MLRIVSIVILCLLSGISNAQYWMQRAGSVNVDEAMDIVVDASGNSYVTGYFSATSDFGNTNLTSAGATDIFVAKVNNQGVYQWAVRAGGAASDRGLSITLDDSNNVIITGYFNGQANFGNTTLTSAGQQDVFIAKYHSNGALQWAKRAGGSSSDLGSGVATDNNNNIVVTGEFKGTSSFGGTTLNSQNTSTDVFITKVAPGGTFLWTQQGSGDQTDRGIDVGCDGSGNIYAVGQFSDTFSFDVTHNNQMFNAAYVAKFNASGVEQWFRIIGGGISCVPYSIDVQSSGNLFIGGDFTGNITFYGSTNQTLNNPYDNGIFVARYSSTGGVSWAQRSGSDSDISCRGIASTTSGIVYAIGHFECTFDEYSNQYGEGIFRNIGFGDIFLSKFNANGSFGWAKHIGSKKSDLGHGVDVGPNGRPHFAGSFQSNLVVPTSDDFISSNLSNWSAASCDNNDGYCNDPHYGTFHRIPSDGNSDIVIANCFDPDRSPLDYFMRPASGCNKSVLSLCINEGCPDSASACNNVIVNAVPKTCANVGPDYYYQWSNSQVLPQTYYNSAGYKWLRTRTKDLCYRDTDSIYIHILPPPIKPKVEDDVVVNEPTWTPQKVDVCIPDTVKLTGSNITTDSFRWEGPGLPSTGVAAIEIYVTISGTYKFFVVDENGCFNQTNIEVEFFDPLDTFLLRHNAPDTVEVCENELFVIQLYDSIDNPTADPICFTDSQPYVNTIWNLSPSGWTTYEICETFLQVEPSDTGWLYFDVMMTRRIPCDSDTHMLSDSVYIIPIPAPTAPPNSVTMVGSEYFCPGSTVLQYGAGGGGPGSYSWAGPFINGLVADSVNIGVAGTYTIFSTLVVTNAYGCSDSTVASDVKQIKQKPQPQVTAASNILCPNDSVWLFASNTGASFGFFWEGPNGPIPGDSNAVLVGEPGTYYVVVNDSDSCELTSNSVILSQYTTPFLVAGGDLVICDDDSLTLSVVSNAGDSIVWLPPLSGNGTSQTIYEPGVYTCMIISCGIETFATIEVFPSYVESEITYEGVLCLDSFMVLHGTDSMHTYTWNINNSGADSLVITSPGTYILTTTDTNGCFKVSDPVTITIEQQVPAITIDGYPVLCEFDTMTLYGNPHMEKYRWTTGDTTQNIQITDDGTYGLWVRDTNGCRGAAQPMEITTPDTIAKFNIEGELEFCEGDSVQFRAKKKGMDTYLWLPDSLYGRTIYFDTSGSHSLFTVDTFGCEAWSEPVDVYMQPNDIEVPVVFDTLICQGEHAGMMASVNVGTIKWSERPYGRVFNEGIFYLTEALFEPITYYLWSDYELCRGDTTSVDILTKDCFNALEPNFFSPNGDGKNDYFSIYLEEIRCLDLWIYNRWGVLIYEGHGVDQKGWDGNVQRSGKPAPESTYYYIAKYCRKDGSEEKIKGFLSLIRE